MVVNAKCVNRESSIVNDYRVSMLQRILESCKLSLRLSAVAVIFFIRFIK